MTDRVAASSAFSTAAPGEAEAATAAAAAATASEEKRRGAATILAAALAAGLLSMSRCRISAALLRLCVGSAGAEDDAACARRWLDQAAAQAVPV